MVKKTFRELREVDILVGRLFSKDPTLEKGKFGYWWKRFAEKSYLPILREYQHEVNDARIDNALEDKDTKEILRDPLNARGYKYSREGEKNVIKAENKIKDEWDKKDFEVETVEVPKANIPELTEEETELLTGILIAPSKKTK